MCHDLFLTDADQYRTGFYGPGKYDGSVVNWVNGPLLPHIGSRRGFDVADTRRSPQPPGTQHHDAHRAGPGLTPCAP